MNKRLGIVVIGRNECAKLGRCLASVVGAGGTVVYVDSGSEDGSADLARAMGVDVVVLDNLTPYSVARGRNAGLVRVRELDPNAEFVQFVDADSELVSSWCDSAVAALSEQSDVAAVFGRVRERHPRKTVYARLYQMDFDAHFSQSDLCGGMGMMRIDAVRELAGFNTAMRGFEDFELSRRLRGAGWRVQRLQHEMVVHEAAMASVGQWCRRKLRSGYARGQEHTLAGGADIASARACRSAWFWGFVLPLVSFAGALPTQGASLLLLGAYPAQVLRFSRRLRRSNAAAADAVLYAGACLLGKFPEAVGLAQFHYERLARQ
jgi:hypothetical protein